MRITDLIKELEKLREEHGDCMVIGQYNSGRDSLWPSGLVSTGKVYGDNDMVVVQVLSRDPYKSTAAYKLANLYAASILDQVELQELPEYESFDFDLGKVEEHLREVVSLLSSRAGRDPVITWDACVNAVFNTD